MGPIEAFTTAWRKSFTYGGKATRSEYWWFYLIDIIATIALLVLSSSGNFNAIAPLGFIYVVASVFPSVSIVFRRLRDIGKKWTWIFINFIPFIGGIWFIILLCQPSGRYQTN